jgi:hypothetical protein
MLLLYESPQQKPILCTIARMVESAEKIFTCEQIPQTWGRFYESVTA